MPHVDNSLILWLVVRHRHYRLAPPKRLHLRLLNTTRSAIAFSREASRAARRCPPSSPRTQDRCRTSASSTLRGFSPRSHSIWLTAMSHVSFFVSGLRAFSGLARLVPKQRTGAEIAAPIDARACRTGLNPEEISYLARALASRAQLHGLKPLRMFFLDAPGRSGFSMRPLSSVHSCGCSAFMPHDSAFICLYVFCGTLKG